MRKIRDRPLVGQLDRPASRVSVPISDPWDLGNTSSGMPPLNGVTWTTSAGGTGQASTAIYMSAADAMRQ